jgi:Ser/Thr protein kinase RdoA (MazF antagonist)
MAVKTQIPNADLLVGLIDFDDSNYTYLGFDLVGLIETWAWPHQADGKISIRRVGLWNLTRAGAH